MSTTHDASSQQSHQPAPDLPAGWHYSDEYERHEERVTAARRRRTLLIVAGVAVALLVAAALVVVNAQTHYARGVAALDRGSYAQAAAELSSARLLVFPYRDAAELSQQADRQLALRDVQAQEAQARLEAVYAALNEASGAISEGDVPGVIAALRSVGATDLRAVMSEDDAAAKVGAVLAADLTTASRTALGRLEWGRAARSAGALLILDPGSTVADAINAKAAAGRKLSAKLADARAAARSGEWRKALRLALAVLAAHKGFPGAQAVVADARTALKPKPKPAATQAVTTPATTTTSTGSTSGGSSSGTSSGPAPP